MAYYVNTHGALSYKPSSCSYNREGCDQRISLLRKTPGIRVLGNDRMADDKRFQRLIQLVRQGDETAAEAVVRAYEPHIRRVVRIRMEDPVLRKALDSMDICQSVLASFFLRAATGQYEIDTPQQLVKLLAVMTRNKIQDWRRKQLAACRDRRRDNPIGNSDHLVVDAESPSQAAAAKELYQQALELMSETERDLVQQWACVASWEQIAKDGGASPDAVRMRIRRCVDRVARQLEE